MSDKTFPFPVIIRMHKKRHRRISNAWEAVEHLRNDWPEVGSSLYRKALHSCLDALDGLKPVAKAHHAFVQAATEAGLIAQPGTH